MNWTYPTVCPIIVDFLSASRNTRMMDEANSWVLKDGFVSYDWDGKMKETLSIPNSSCFLSILFLPKASDHDLEEALTRANAWLNASQNCGVPIVFMNIQTESLISTVNPRICLHSTYTILQHPNIGCLVWLHADVRGYGFNLF